MKMNKSIGRYEIREELGRGGMGVVYLAEDSRLDRQVALKLLNQQLSADPSFAARFEQEARTVAGLSHTAIVSLYDFGEADGWLYLVMPYMQGGTLKEAITRNPLSPEKALNVLTRIGGALDKAHSQGIVHRDLKPANILLDQEEQPYLSDFGIVKMAQGEAERLTDTGRTLGTFAYMSPEQVMGEALDGRSDLYALGLILYEMLTGKHPYAQATTDGAMAVAQTQKTAPDIALENPALPAGCQAVIEKALAKNPADRYASGSEMARAFRAALAGKATATRATSATQSPAGEKKRKLPAWLFVVAGLAIIAVIAVFVFALAGPSSTKENAAGEPSPTAAISQAETNENQTGDRPPPAVVVDQNAPDADQANGSKATPTGQVSAVLTATATISESADLSQTLTLSGTSAARSTPATATATRRAAAAQVIASATPTTGILASNTPTATPAPPTPTPSPTPDSVAASAMYAAAVQSFNVDKNYEKASEQINEAIRLDPRVADYYYLRAQIRAQLGNHAEALTDIAEAIRLRPDKADYYQWRGYWYWNRSMWELSIPDLEKAVELNPTHSYQLTVLARAYKFVGKYEAMHQAYQQAIAVGALNDPFPYTNYAYNIYPDLGTFDEAVAILYDCEANLTSNAHSCAWERADLSVTAGRTADAVAAYKRYLELVPQGVETDRQQQARDYISEHGG
jgi:serine/threonine protein kinase/Flp pilus assembly protein TadD